MQVVQFTQTIATLCRVAIRMREPKCFEKYAPKNRTTLQLASVFRARKASGVRRAQNDWQYSHDSRTPALYTWPNNTNTDLFRIVGDSTPHTQNPTLSTAPIFINADFPVHTSKTARHVLRYNHACTILTQWPPCAPRIVSMEINSRVQPAASFPSHHPTPTVSSSLALTSLHGRPMEAKLKSLTLDWIHFDMRLVVFRKRAGANQAAAKKRPSPKNRSDITFSSRWWTPYLLRTSWFVGLVGVVGPAATQIIAWSPSANRGRNVLVWIERRITRPGLTHKNV